MQFYESQYCVVIYIYIMNMITLFAVSLVQESVAMSGSMVNQDAYITEARQIRDLVSKLNGFHLDHTEYTCLKALALFKPGKYTKCD